MAEAARKMIHARVDESVYRRVMHVKAETGRSVQEMVEDGLLLLLDLAEHGEREDVQ